MMLSYNGLKTLRVRNNELIEFYSDNSENQQDISRPFTPDAIVYCKSNYLFLNEDASKDVLAEAGKMIPSLGKRYGYLPKSDFNQRDRLGGCW